MEPTEEEQVFVTSIAWSVEERRYDGPPIVRDKPLAGNGPNEASTTAVRDKKRKNQNVVGEAGEASKKARRRYIPVFADHIGFPPDLLLHSEIDIHHMPHIEKRHMIYQYVKKQNNCLILLLLWLLLLLLLLFL